MAELANAAADEIKADLVNVKNNLTATSLVANNAQAAVDEAKQDLTEVASELNTAKQDLANSVTEVNTKVDSAKAELTQAKQDLQAQASQLTAQANAQSELTNRVSSVEETANGTKTTVSELSKTVDSNTKNITSVTARTKVVEDDLLNTKTTMSQVKTTADGASQKTAALETGLNGLSAKFSNLRVGGVNLIKQSTAQTGLRLGMDAGPFPDSKHALTDWIKIEPSTVYTLTTYEDVTETNMWYSLAWYSSNVNDYSGWISRPTGAATAADLKGGKQYTSPANATYAKVSYPNNYPKVKLERGNIATDYSPSEADIEQKVADYKQTADQNYASLQTTVQNLDGTVQQNKTTAEQTAAGFKTRIESLETYKNSENIRANQYFESAKTETARQLTAERTAIAKDYVAKSTYTSDVTGIRNDLSATTTTASATKTNLANYQASNDKAVANLQSNLQTANGNISSLKTKVEAVPGQITSAVSAVEGKIPKSLGGRNLIIRSQIQNGYIDANGNLTTATSQFTTGFIDGTNSKQFTITAPKFVLGNLEWLRLAKYDTNKNFMGRDVISYNKDAKTVKNIDLADNIAYFKVSFDGAYGELFKIERGSLATDWSPAPEDAIEEISSLSSQIQQTADGMTLLATKTELNTARSDLQSGITTATNKANTAQSTADSNAQTISTHTTQISALNTGLQAKVSQSDFNTLSGRVTTSENNIIAKANELSSKISSVEGQIPSGEMNLVEYGRPADGYSPYNYAEYATHSFYYNSAYKMYIIKNTATSEKTFGMNRFKVERNTDYTLYFKGFNNSAITHMDVWFLKRVNGSTKDFDSAQILVSGRKLSVSKAEDVSVTFNTGNYDEGFIRFDNNGSTTAGTQADLYFGDVSVKKGKSNNGWSPSLAELASSQDLKSAQSEIKQTTNSITASVQSLDNSTVKSSSLTINTDGVVIKAGKSTSDFANAVGSYFSVNQNAINLFSDKINVKGNMIVDGAITSTKIASKTIDTAHLNGKIITADVISSNAVTADAIKAGAVTTDKMSANSINGDRITAGTLDAAKIKAGSITASQIASGTITSAQIKTGTISAGNIATGAITTDKIAANSINSDKIVSSGITANVINGGKLQSLTNTTNFDLDTGKLFYNNNNTGVFRVEDGASTMGLKFSNTAITVNNTSRILSRVILGGDRRETTLDDGKWDQGGFTGIVAETINGVDSNQHAQADTLRVIGDNIYFTHSYNYDSLTSTSAQGWKMETFSPFSSYAGNVVLKPYGINYRQSDIITGDIRLDNGDGSGYWVRGCIRTLRNCFQHYLNGGTTSGAMNAIRDALKEISGV